MIFCVILLIHYRGHSVLMGKLNNDWQETHYVLKLFGKSVSSARKGYRGFVEKGVKKGRRPDLTGGGLVRTAGGWAALKAYRRRKIHIKGDERILGDSDFINSVLKEQNERLERGYRIQIQGYDFDKIADRIVKTFQLKPEELLSNIGQRQRVNARSVLCYWAVNELKLPGAAVARRLKMSNSAVSHAVVRGERIASDMELKLFED